MRLPNGYGSIIKLKGKRRKPFQVRLTKGFTDERKTNIYVFRLLWNSTKGYDSTILVQEFSIRYNSWNYYFWKSVSFME